MGFFVFGKIILFAVSFRKVFRACNGVAKLVRFSKIGGNSGLSDGIMRISASLHSRNPRESDFAIEQSKTWFMNEYFRAKCCTTGESPPCKQYTAALHSSADSSGDPGKFHAPPEGLKFLSFAPSPFLTHFMYFLRVTRPNFLRLAKRQWEMSFESFVNAKLNLGEVEVAIGCYSHNFRKWSLQTTQV